MFWFKILFFSYLYFWVWWRKKSYWIAEKESKNYYLFIFWWQNLFVELTSFIWREIFYEDIFLYLILLEKNESGQEKNKISNWFCIF